MKYHYTNLRKDVAILSDRLNKGIQDSISTTDVWHDQNQKRAMSLSGDISKVVERSNVGTSEDRLLDSLYFARIEERHERIPEAHAETFKWAFEQRRQLQKSQHSFRSWLETFPGRDRHFLDKRKGWEW